RPRFGTEIGTPQNRHAKRLNLLVEAGGIEPPSEGASPSASTSVADDLILAALAPIGRIARGQPAKISVPAPPASRGPSPRRWRLFRPYGRGPGKRGRLIRQPVRSLRLQLSSPDRFDEVTRTPDSHRPLPHPRRSHIAPERAE